jgi:Putative papain-like cysteine peptidase (DUF1796)
MRYDKVIGLGGNCEVAEHLRRYLGTDRANIMDWWVTPLTSVPKLLDERFSNLARPENMRLVANDKSVMCRYYGIAHHHDFPRREDTTIDGSMIESQAHLLREKYAMLADRFVKDCAGHQRVLFVRSWRDRLDIPPTPYATDDIVQYDFAGTVAAIERNFPALDFSILFVNYGIHTSDDPRALFHNVEDKGDGGGWSGSAGGWDEMLDRYTR